MLPALFRLLCIHAERANFQPDQLTMEAKQAVYSDLLIGLMNIEKLEEIDKIITRMEKIVQLNINVNYSCQKMLLAMAAPHLPVHQQHKGNYQSQYNKQQTSNIKNIQYSLEEIEGFFMRRLILSARAYETMRKLYETSHPINESKHDSLLSLASSHHVQLLQPAHMLRIQLQCSILHRLKKQYGSLSALSRASSFTPYSPSLSSSSSSVYTPLLLPHARIERLTVREQEAWRKWNLCIAKVEQYWHEVQPSLLSPTGASTYSSKIIIESYHKLLMMWQNIVEYDRRTISIFQEYFDWRHKDYKLDNRRHAWKSESVWYLMLACSHVEPIYMPTAQQYAHDIYMRIHREHIQIVDDDKEDAWVKITDEALWSSVRSTPSRLDLALPILTLASEQHHYKIRDNKLAHRMISVMEHDSSLSFDQRLSNSLYIFHRCDANLRFSPPLALGILSLALKCQWNRNNFDMLHKLLTRLRTGGLNDADMSTAYLYFIGICAKTPSAHRADEEAESKLNDYWEKLKQLNSDAKKCTASQHNVNVVIQLCSSASHYEVASAISQWWKLRQLQLQQEESVSTTIG